MKGQLIWSSKGNLDTQLGRAGDRTSKLPVTSQPILPPELGRPSSRFLRKATTERGTIHDEII